ncbi:hypothetical protein ABMA10_04150 [Plantibacter sp. RU18]
MGASAVPVDTGTDAIDQVAPEVYDDVARTVDSSSPDAIAESLANNVSLVVPTSGSEPVELSDARSGLNLNVTLPTDIHGAVAQDGENGTIEYVGETTTATVVPKNDGSVQFVTTIADASAPIEYKYTFDLPEGAQIVLPDGDTAPVILDASGGFLAGIAPAWARDANGVDVPTRYVLDGSAVTQVVEHDAPGVAYPVVADPWLGIPLIQAWGWTSEGGGWRMNSTPTPWSRSQNAVTASTYWMAIGYAGWDELANMQNTTQRARMNVSMQQQHVCHQGFASADPEWNVEGYKAARGDIGGWISTHCN